MRVHRHLAECDPHHPDFSQLLHWIHTALPISVPPEDLANQRAETISSMIVDKARNVYDTRVGGLPMELLDHVERRMVLVAIDRQWQQHLDGMDELREGVYLRAQGQKDPLVEHKNEAYELFPALMDEIRQEALQNLFRAAAGLGEFLVQQQNPLPLQSKISLNPSARAPLQTTKVLGRNSACTCGSGRKYKQCCGRLA